MSAATRLRRLDESAAITVVERGEHVSFAGCGLPYYVGGVIAVDAVAHLPLIGFFLPGPMEFVGTSAAILLAARYYVTKDSTPGEDFANFVRTIPADVPAVDDVVNLCGSP